VSIINGSNGQIWITNDDVEPTATTYTRVFTETVSTSEMVIPDRTGPNRQNRRKLAALERSIRKTQAKIRQMQRYTMAAQQALRRGISK